MVQVSTILYLAALAFIFLPAFLYVALMRGGLVSQSLDAQIAGGIVFCLGVAILILLEKKELISK